MARTAPLIVFRLLVYFAMTTGQAPDPEWDERIGGVSRKFNEIKERAVRWGAEHAGGAGRAATMPEAQ